MTVIRSRLYDCSVLHSRFRPVEHRFVYRYFTFCIDLDEAAALSRKRFLFGLSKGRLFRFNPADFFMGGHQSLEDLKMNLLSYVTSKGVKNASRVEVIGHMRTLGYAYNPAAFFIFYSDNNEMLCSLVEVTNTFKERKIYFVPAPSSSSVSISTQKKMFYVSPFSPLDSEFHFKVNRPQGNLMIQIDSFDKGALLIHSRLSGKEVALSDFNLFTRFCKYLWVPLWVMYRIHWQAFRLYLKKVPFIRKNSQIDLQKGGLS